MSSSTVAQPSAGDSPRFEENPLDDARLFTPRPWLAALTLAEREWVRFVRQRNRVIGALVQPILFWLLFGVGLGPSFRLPAGENGAGGASYSEYFFPGTLVLILLFTAIFATISIIEDRREGFLQSVLVAPQPRWAMVLGKIAGASAIALAQSLLFLAIGGGLGYVHASFSGLFFAILLMAVISLALTSLGFVIAWRMDSTQGFHAIMSVLLLPMWLLSGSFFPPEAGQGGAWGPRVLGLIMQINPLTYGVAGLRRLLCGDAARLLPLGTPSSLLAWSVTIIFAGAMFAWATRISARRTSADLL